MIRELFARKGKAQGATEYLLMLAAVLVIVAVAVYYVTRAGGYPVVSATAAKSDNELRINVETGTIAAGDWQYSVSTTSGTYSWTDGTSELKSPYFSLGQKPAENYYVSLKHKPSGHIYFADTKITIS